MVTEFSLTDQLLELDVGGVLVLGVSKSHRRFSKVDAPSLLRVGLVSFFMNIASRTFEATIYPPCTRPWRCSNLARVLSYETAFQKCISQSEFSYHPLRAEKSFSEIFGSKSWELLDSFNLFLMSFTNTYRNIHSRKYQQLWTYLIHLGSTKYSNTLYFEKSGSLSAASFAGYN